MMNTSHVKYSPSTLLYAEYLVKNYKRLKEEVENETEDVIFSIFSAPPGTDFNKGNEVSNPTLKTVEAIASKNSLRQAKIGVEAVEKAFENIDQECRSFVKSFYWIEQHVAKKKSKHEKRLRRKVLSLVAHYAGLPKKVY